MRYGGVPTEKYCNNTYMNNGTALKPDQRISPRISAIFTDGLPSIIMILWVIRKVENIAKMRAIGTVITKSIG